MNLAKVHKMVTKVQSSLFRHSNSYFQGVFQTNFKGSGVQFKEHQVYQYGDEIRFIDWNLLARKNMTYVKTFEEERNVHILCVLPVRASLIFRDSHETKLEAALETICFFILMAGKTKDFVDVLIDFEGQTLIKNLQGEMGLVNLFSVVEKMMLLNEEGKINYNRVVKANGKFFVNNCRKYFEKNKQIVLLSDQNSLSLKEENHVFKAYKISSFCFFVNWELSHKKNEFIFDDWGVLRKLSNSDETLNLKRDESVSLINVDGDHLEGITQSLLKGKL
jgi:hypothetical protein